jgi:hypothetical protein
MKTLRAIAGAVLASLLAAVCLPGGPAWAQQGTQPDPLFILPGGSIFELDARGSSTEVFIPLLASAELKKDDELLPPELLSVALGHRHDGAFSQALALEYVPQGNITDSSTPCGRQTGRPMPTALKVRVNLDTLIEPGTYSVMVGTRAVRKVEPASASGQETLFRTLSFQLTRPAATVAASLSPTSLEREVGFSTEPVKVPLSLSLKETTQYVRVTHLEIDGAELSSEAQQDLALPAGALKTIALLLPTTGEVGKITGNLLIRSPQLSHAVEVPYEVTLRRPRWHIFLTLILGLLFGYVVRVLLKRRIENGVARSESIRQRRKLLEEQARYVDEDYRAALDRILAALAAEEPRSAAHMKAALSTAHVDFTTAQTELTARIQTAVTLGEGLQKRAGERSYSLPAAMAQAVTAALVAVENAEKRVSLDPKGVKGSLEKANASFQRSLSQGAQDWKRALTTALEVLGESNLKWPAAMADKVDSKMAEVMSTVRSDPSDREAATPEQLLQSVHLSVEKIWMFCAWLWSSLSPVAKQVLNTLDKAKKDPASLDALRTVLHDLEERWTGKMDPEALVNALPEDAGRLLEALNQAICRNTSNSVNEQTKELLKQGDYVRAANQAISEQTLLGAPGEEQVPASDSFSGLRATLPRIEQQSFVSPDPRPPISLEQLEARTLSQLMVDQLLQTALVALALCFGAYILFEKSFTGTLNDYAALLFWAFGTDVTVETLNVLAASHKKPTSP